LINKVNLIQKEVPTISLDDSVSKAINLMYINSIKQIPVVDLNNKYCGMIYYKDFINTHFQTSSKIKHFISHGVHILKPNDDLQICINYMINTGKTGLPVVDNEKFVGLVIDKDLVLNVELGNLKVNDIMSKSIFIDENSDLDNALSLMRKNNISRLPVINNKHLIVGVISLLDILKIISIPAEKDSHTSGFKQTTKPGSVLVKDIMRNALTVESGSIIKNTIDNFKNGDELIIISNDKPVGIITSKDILEVSLAKKTDSIIYAAHFEDESIRNEITQKMEKFIKKIEGKLDNIQSVVIYFEKHKTLCSIRTRIITKNQVIHTHSDDYDPLKAFKSVLEKIDRQITELHSKNVENKFREKILSADEEI
jgi:predicted transcriptional regulator/ribosome-associated translation inhibitor RaiA